MPKRPASMDKCAAVLGAVLLAAALGSCATSEDRVASFYADPAKFMLYPCPALAVRAREVAERDRELQALMAKAGADPAGRLVTAAAYRNEYFAGRGEMREIEKAAANKKCPPMTAAPKPARRSGSVIQ